MCIIMITPTRHLKQIKGSVRLWQARVWGSSRDWKNGRFGRRSHRVLAGSEKFLGGVVGDFGAGSGKVGEFRRGPGRFQGRPTYGFPAVGFIIDLNHFESIL